jgi:hypothetical protein
MKNAVFWYVTPCRSCMNWRYGGTYRLHLQGRGIRERGTNVSRWLQTEPPVENNQLYKKIEEGRVGPPKRRFTQDLHSATSQKTAFFIVTAVKTSNLTELYVLFISPYVIQWRCVNWRSYFASSRWKNDHECSVAKDSDLWGHNQLDVLPQFWLKKLR